MNGSSGTKAITTLSRLHAKQIFACIDILRTTSVREIAFVESLQNDRAGNFRETVWFLKQIEWLHESRGKIELTSRALAEESSTEGQISRAVLNCMAECPGPVGHLLGDYLVQFQTFEGNIVHQPSAQLRLEQSFIRNLLIELGAVRYEAESDSYLLGPDFTHLYFWARNIHCVTSKAHLAAAAAAKEQLGTAAELSAVAFERSRVGPLWESRVEHISLKFPFACFDIKSVTIVEGSPLNRFIEVKAVPADTFDFFWTASEVEAAQFLTENYFLYLLPVLDGQTFDLSKIMIVRNPYRTIFQFPDEWSVKQEVVSCRRRRIS